MERTSLIMNYNINSRYQTHVDGTDGIAAWAKICTAKDDT